MKKNAIVRILIWSALIVTLIGVLIYSVKNQDDMSFNFFNIGVNESVVSKYENADSYSVGNGTIQDAIHNIDIEWLNGDVKVVPYGEDIIKIEEVCDEELKEEYVLRWKTENDTLTIKPCESGAKSKKFPEKQLVIYVPQETANTLSKGKIDTVSAKIEISDFCIEELMIDTVSGGATLMNCDLKIATINSVSGKIDFVGNAADLTANGVSGDISISTENASEKIEAMTTSGKVSITGEADDIIADTTSGSIFVSANSAPKKLQASSVSGKITLEIPENEGFTLKYETVSGTLTNDFEAQNSKDTIVYANGTNDYEIETTSGNISIKKK